MYQASSRKSYVRVAADAKTEKGGVGKHPHGVATHLSGNGSALNQHTKSSRY
jgi:hypothetical protein